MLQLMSISTFRKMFLNILLCSNVFIYMRSYIGVVQMRIGLIIISGLSYASIKALGYDLSYKFIWIMS